MRSCPDRRPPSGPSSPAGSVGRRRLAVPILAGCTLLAIAGCAAPGNGQGSGIASFPGSGSSLTDIGERVVEGLTGGNLSALAALRLSKSEYVEVVWPELPASDPDLRVPLEYVWADIEARNRRALTRLAPQFEGLPAELRDVACRGGTEEFRTFRVHTDCWVTLRTAAGDQRIQPFKDVLERGAGYKIFRYYDSTLRAAEGS